MVKTKLVSASGRFGVRYGVSVRRRIADIEAKQRQKQLCIFCGGIAKRLSKGIWLCKRCGKKFAGHTYFLEQAQKLSTEEKVAQSAQTKVLNKEKAVIEEAKQKKDKKTKTGESQ